MDSEYLQTNKKAIRKEILLKRDALSIQEKERAKILITERILGHQWFYLSDIILAFVSYGSEINTSLILEETLTKGKSLFLPKIIGDEMFFYQVTNFEDLSPGFHGIMEPSGDTLKYCFEDFNIGKTLMLMPGVAFDPTRNRIGYGRGFYDRFLSDKPQLQLRTIAISHKCQMVDHLPYTPEDIKPYQIICV